MGSTSDLPVMQAAIDTLADFGIEVDKRVISAHRAPHALMEWAESAEERGCSGSFQDPGRLGQPAVYGADAERNTGGYRGD